MPSIILPQHKPKQDLYLLVESDVRYHTCLYVGISPQELAWWCDLYDRIFFLGKDAFLTLHSAVNARLQQLYYRQQLILKEFLPVSEEIKYFETLRDENIQI